jgi:hypothetical protein
VIKKAFPFFKMEDGNGNKRRKNDSRADKRNIGTVF